MRKVKRLEHLEQFEANYAPDQVVLHVKLLY